MSAELDLVITAGGVGPTPDDVTIAGKLGHSASIELDGAQCELGYVVNFHAHTHT